MIFDGYVKDIKESFVNVFKKEPETVEDLNIINVSLYLLLSSYYFEGNYKYTQIGYNKDGETFIAYIPNKKNEEELLNTESGPATLSQYMKKKGLSNSRVTNNDDIEINDFNKFYTSGVSNKHNDLTRLSVVSIPEDVSLLISDLKKNDFYNILFESSKIKQDLLIKTKKDYNYTIVDKKDVDKFLIESFKSQSLSVDDVYKCLNRNYDLRFFTKEKVTDEDDFLIFTHNQYEIAGICSVNKNEAFKKNARRNDFFNVTSVMVSSNARGNGIGVNMFKEVVKEAEKRSICLVRTGASNQGRNFLKASIDNESKNSSVPIINAEHLPHLYNPILEIINKSNIKKEQNKMINELLSDVREFQESISLRKKNAKSIDDVYEAENAEEDYLKSLSLKKNKIKKSFNL